MFYAVTTGRKQYAVNNEHAAKGFQSQENAGEDLSHCVLSELHCVLSESRCLLSESRCLLSESHCVLVELRCVLVELHCVLAELRFEQRLEGAVVTGFHAHLRTHRKK